MIGDDEIRDGGQFEGDGGRHPELCPIGKVEDCRGEKPVHDKVHHRTCAAGDGEHQVMLKYFS